MKLGHLTGEVIQAAIRVHSILGPGLLESAYRKFLVHDLTRRGIAIDTEFPVSVTYEGATVDVGYRIDLLVEKQVVVELKTVSQLLPVHHAQLLSYLRLGGYPVGLLINFHVRRLRDGLQRVVN
jgi:GxxExxY protein